MQYIYIIYIPFDKKPIPKILLDRQKITKAQNRAGLKLPMKNNQKGFNFHFLRGDSKFI